MTPPSLRLALPMAAAFVLASLAGCSSSETREKIEKPVRFAVLAAPELGADDGDLLSAVTRLSREKELAFVLVLGPLFAADADATALETLKNDLGQIAAPVYVSFACVAPVTTAPAGKPTSDEILAAVECLGPGTTHKLAYIARPPRAKSVAVMALAPDGTGTSEKVPPDAERVIEFGAPRKSSTPVGPPPDLAVSVATGAAVELVGAPPEESNPAESTVLVRVPPLARKLLAIVTLTEKTVEVAPLAVEGASPPPPPAVVAPTISRKPPG